MRAKIQKWGNSFALRIPKAFAEEVGVDAGSSVEIRVVDGQIHIVPVLEPHYELEALLEDITTDNRHEETHTGKPIGNEIW